VFESIKIEYINKPFHIEELPIGNKVYVLDDYIESSIHHAINNQLTNMATWSKTNCVRGSSRTGLPHHEFWGSSFFIGQNGMMMPDDRVPIHHTYLMKWFNRRIMTDFGFKWKRFQYLGTNSQSHGQHGTTHSDCAPEDDWNLSFLYYYNIFWNEKWGGTLRFYDKPQQGLDGRNEHISNHQIAEVDFKPNRLLMFDGRIPHGADAPNSCARYADRRSIVLRGDEVELVEKEDFYNANDRLYNF
tara:strand:- start:1804 stop:2535 length:732 start_codon:yes stop_codon:yes gene_type:complete